MLDIREKRQFRVHLDCYPCFLRQTVIAVNLGTDDESLKTDVIKAVLKDIEDADSRKSPAHATTFMHRRIRSMLKGDPFEDIKALYNIKALELYPGLKKTVSESDDPLITAVRLAIAGNIIDFGIFSSVDIEGTIKRALESPLEVDDSLSFREHLENSDSILYLLDNAGEAVFDRVLIEELISSGKMVTAVAKGSPVINDCTLRDAEEAGINGACNVIDNGSDAVGTMLDETSEEFAVRFRDSDTLVISKGQGNFETLMLEDRKMFFLFQSKCDVLSEFLGVPAGSMILAGNGRGGTASTGD